MDPKAALISARAALLSGEHEEAAEFLGAYQSWRIAGDLPPGCTLIGWQCGFEPLFVAVGSYLPNCYVGADEAEELAADYLTERDWFGEGAPARDADYVFPSTLEC